MWADSIDTEMIHIDTSSVDSYAQSYDDSGEIIYEKEMFPSTDLWLIQYFHVRLCQAKEQWTV